MIRLRWLLLIPILGLWVLGVLTHWDAPIQAMAALVMLGLFLPLGREAVAVTRAVVSALRLRRGEYGSPAEAARIQMGR